MLSSEKFSLPETFFFMIFECVAERCHLLITVCKSAFFFTPLCLTVAQKLIPDKIELTS